MASKRSAKAEAPPASAIPSEVKVQPAKGRPMLQWVGKRPLTRVPAYPAQHIETFDPTGSLGKSPADPALWRDWPSNHPRGGLLFHGDNQEVLAHLLANGYRGQVDLVYIDPPFDSGADYVRRVTLRGDKRRVDAEGQSLGEQVQYTDIWSNDAYLQFMFERLLLLRELMAPDSTLFVHCDSGRNYQIRFLLDEVFGAESFRNEIVWWYWNKFQGNVNRFASNHDTILCYTKGAPPFSKIEEERPETVRQLKRVWDPASGSLVNARDEDGNLIYVERSERTVDDVWRISMLQPADETENLRFPTQKPEDLLSMVVESSSQPGSLVLDCFAGSGTTAAVAQRLGRRWIACDINRGAIQTTSKRLQILMHQQEASQRLVADDDAPAPAQRAFTVWRVNDYDLQIQHNEAVNLACDLIGVERLRSDGFFDGTLKKGLVKVVPFNHPLTPLDLEEVRRELEARPDEDRTVTLVSLGIEIGAQAWIDEWNQMRRGQNAVNRIEVIELRTDPRYGGVIRHEPARAKVKVQRTKGRLHIEIEDFVSPTIIQRLQQQGGLLNPQVDDWRAMVDSISIDPAYNGEILNIAIADVPERKSDLVSGKYDLEAPEGETTVAVKIIDMLGEEVLVTERV